MYYRNKETIKGVVFSYTKNSRFVLTVTAAMLCLTIVILWGGFGFPPGMRNFISYVIFTHTGPAYTVVLWGFVLDYIIGEEPPPKLQLIYTAGGCILFLTVCILQLYNLDDYYGNKVLVLFAIHVTIFLLLAILLYLALRRQLYSNKKVQRPYVVRVSRGGVPIYK